MATMTSTAEPAITLTTILSLLSTVVILLSAYLLSTRLLSPTTTTLTIRVLFIWHAFDALIHTILEGSFLYNCFFTYTTHPLHGLWPLTGGYISPYLPPNIHFLAQSHRLYGANFGGPGNPFAALWREYARADARWGGADLTVISLELLTVFIGAPLAAYICRGLSRNNENVWFWMVVLATGELYGGFMTFAPEWLSGNVNLNGEGHWMLLWLYLIFFNMVWVIIPLWVLWVSYEKVVRALAADKVKRN